MHNLWIAPRRTPVITEKRNLCTRKRYEIARNVNSHWGHITALLQRDENFQQANEYNDLSLKYCPDDRNALQLKAQLLADWKKNYQDALHIFTKLLEREGPGNGSLYYNIAATYSKMNRPDASLKFLKLAMSISEGWGYTGNAQADKDFENLRKDRRFWALVKKQ